MHVLKWVLTVAVGFVCIGQNASANSSLLAVGANHELIVDSQGTIWPYGDGGFGQLGATLYGDTINIGLNNYCFNYAIAFVESDCVQSVENTSMGAVKSVSAGGNYSMALSSSGKLWGWGTLGDSAYDSLQPKLIDTIAPNSVLDYSVGPTSTILVAKADGTVYSWGRNCYGELGWGRPDAFNCANVFHATPTMIPGLSNIVAVAGGDNFSVALGSDGKVWTWGDNRYGKLGDGTTVSRTTPQLVPGLSESPRILRRLQLLRKWSHEYI